MINPYLTFGGNCREAMQFYQRCLGGALQIQTIGQSPMATSMPAYMQDRVLHAALVSASLVLMGTDMAPDEGLKPGNTVSLLLHCASEAHILALYAALAEGGVAVHPPERTVWGALFGNLTDKYGHHWLLNFEQPAFSDQS